MDRQTAVAQFWLRMLLVALLVGCGCAPTQTLVPPARDRASDRSSRSLEALPSPHAAALLPAGARYRVVLANEGTLALAVMGADQRILGRLAIAAGAGPHASPAVRIEVEDVEGRTLQIEAWSFAGALHGQAFMDGRAVSWRVRHEHDGSLAGERWSVPQRDAPEPLARLHRAKALEADLALLATQLSDDCVLAERVALAELALELSIRAWAGHGRSRLPSIGVLDDPCAL